MAWNLRSEEPLEYSCVVESLMAAWVKGDLPLPAAQASVPYAHQARTSLYTLYKSQSIIQVFKYPTILDVTYKSQSTINA